MDHVFHKLLNKMWWIRDGPEITLLILKQICEDARTYMRRVVSCECALMDLTATTKYVRRSQSTPNLLILKSKCP
jgi:hypothetical protein